MNKYFAEKNKHNVGKNKHYVDRNNCRVMITNSTIFNSVYNCSPWLFYYVQTGYKNNACCNGKNL